MTEGPSEVKQWELDGMKKKKKTKTKKKRTALLDSSATNYPLLQSNSLFDQLQFAFASDWVSAWKLRTMWRQRRQCNSICKSSLKKWHWCSQPRTLPTLSLKTHIIPKKIWVYYNMKSSTLMFFFFFCRFVFFKWYVTRRNNSKSDQTVLFY